MTRSVRLALLIAPALLLGCNAPAGALSGGEKAVLAPPAAVQAKEKGPRAVAIFAGGCFWGVEAVFSHVKGVEAAASGYHGGDKASADYDRVSGGGTAHAEAVRIVYDPQLVRYDQLLRVFFSVVADPTQKNRQGPDIGTQYRSALVPMNAEQARVGKAYLAQLDRAGLWSAPIVTALEPARTFYPAESYHQDFLFKHPDNPYIRRWDQPKLAALKRLFPGLYHPKPVRDGG